MRHGSESYCKAYISIYDDFLVTTAELWAMRQVLSQAHSTMNKTKVKKDYMTQQTNVHLKQCPFFLALYCAFLKNPGPDYVIVLCMPLRIKSGI